MIFEYVSKLLDFEDTLKLLRFYLNEFSDVDGWCVTYIMFEYRSKLTQIH